MIESLRKIINFIRFVGLILTDKGGYGKKQSTQLLLDYSYAKLLTCLPCFISQKVRQLKLIGNKVEIFDLGTTVSIIESIFIENEYHLSSNKKNPIIIDLGSNIGLSVIYFKTHFPGAKILSFEPDPITYQKLFKNIKINHLSKTKALNMAVSDKKGEIDFYIDLAGPGSPLMSINKQRLPKDKINVSSVKLSDYICESVDLIKMDIEGAEEQVISDLVKNNKLHLIKQIIIEYHHHIDDKKDTLSSFLKQLEAGGFGYQIHASQRPPFTQGSFEDILIFAYNKTN